MLEIKPIFKALMRSKVGAVLLLLQIAITTAIVSNAAFIIYDRVTYLAQDTGYDEENVFSFAILTFGKDRDLMQQTELDETFIRNLPGVIDAAAMSAVPLSGSGSATGFTLKPQPEISKRARAAYIQGDEHVLNTLGLTLLEGRNFTSDEVVVTESAREVPNVVVVTKTFIDELFPEGNGLGQTIYMGDLPAKVIGIVESVSGPWLKDSRPKNIVFIPLMKAMKAQNFVVRTESGAREEIMKNIESELLQQYPDRVIDWLTAFDKSKDEYNAGDILMMRMLIVLIAVLVGVTALGIFGLTLFNISKRTKQIGTRRALGARKSAIIRYFLIENSMISLVGLVIGCFAAHTLGQLLMQHYEIPVLPIGYIIGTALSVFVMSWLAVIGPAKRAADISPSIATRSI
ncbi:ABC transporter permease [Pseudoalteromonas luteoviolacea B = ATCC 29581]|nr:ABC transporter permease [Pseudoalteromonas luteoviolacea B = ATCC 29581]